PAVIGEDPDPVAKPPPWHHTITGRLRPSSRAGVQTLSTRQSSLSCGSPAPATARSDALRRAPGSLCGALGPYSSASRTPVHFATGAGGMKRFRPAVFAPYGMPLKILIPSTSTPRTFPEAVSATTYVSAPKACRTPKADAAVSAEACFTKSRRVRGLTP